MKDRSGVDKPKPLTFGDIVVGDSLEGFNEKWLITKVKPQGEQVTFTTVCGDREKERRYFKRDRIVLWRVTRGGGR